MYFQKTQKLGFGRAMIFALVLFCGATRACPTSDNR